MSLKLASLTLTPCHLSRRDQIPACFIGPKELLYSERDALLPSASLLLDLNYIKTRKKSLQIQSTSIQ